MASASQCVNEGLKQKNIMTKTYTIVIDILEAFHSSRVYMNSSNLLKHCDNFKTVHDEIGPEGPTKLQCDHGGFKRSEPILNLEIHSKELIICDNCCQN